MHKVPYSSEQNTYKFSMAMQSGTTMIVQERPWYNYQQQQHQLDERDGFLMWLRGEFAAANAIIDALCHHLQAVGDPGEYDGVIGCIQQRRCNWNPILHMQHYFSVAEITYALQQVGWRRQQRAVGFEGGARMEGGGTEYWRGGRGYGGGVAVQNLGGGVKVKDSSNVFVESKFNVNGKLDGGGEKGIMEEKRGEEEKGEMNEKSEVDSLANRLGSIEEVLHTKDKAQVAGEGACNLENSGVVLQGKRNLEVSPTTFVATEICDGKPVNVVDGMKLYKEVFDDSEISNLITLVNDLRTAGRRGHLQGQSFALSKRPVMGHGRETIQLGVPIADAPAEDETAAGIPKDLRTEPIPTLLQYAIERLLTEHVVSVKPDSCIIDIYNEGDHSQPHIWPLWFGRPVCILFLTECEMSFGKVMAVDPEHFRGALKLSLSPGSMLVMQGRSADFARHAIPSARKQRVIVTLTKSKPKKMNPGDVRHFPSVAVPSSHWVPPPTRSPNHICPMAAKHYGPVPPTGVLSTLTAHQQTPQPNGIQPVFVSTPVAPAVAFPAAVALPPASAGWTAAPPRHPPPRLLVPGTGVFLPSQSSSNSSNQLSSASTLETEHVTLEMSVESEKDDGLGKSNCISTSQNIYSKVPQQEYNRGMGGTTMETAIRKEELQEILDSSKSEKAI